MQLPKPIIIKATDDNQYFDISAIPPIDRNRIIAVYVRQSDKDADTEHGESLATQLALRELAVKLQNGREHMVKMYQEEPGTSGRKRIDQREKLNELYADLAAGLIGTIIVAREDRLFRDRHGDQSGTFTRKAEEMSAAVLVPPLKPGQKLRYYDFSQHSHLRAFQDKMQQAADYIDFHIGYMHLNQRNKALRGCYDGRGLPPGLVVEKTTDPLEKANAKPVLYEPWAEIMRNLWKRAKELGWRFNLLIREIDAMPYLFPAPSEDDKLKYYFPTSMRKVKDGYKPHGYAVKSWFKCRELAGDWTIGTYERQGNKKILVELRVKQNNHPAVIDNRELFEEGYIAATGYNLDGVEVPEARKDRKFVERKERETPAELVLRYCLTSPQATFITPRTRGDEKKPYDAYLGVVMTKDGLLIEYAFCVHGPELDRVVAERLGALAAADLELANRIRQFLVEIQKAQQKVLKAIDDQLETIAAKLKRARARLADVEKDMDADTLEALRTKIRELVIGQNELEAKRERLKKVKGVEEIEKFYGLLGNFEERYHKMELDEKQRLFELLTDRIEIEAVSQHWLKLTINWISPVIGSRPDVCFIWRNIPSKGQEVTPEEVALLKKHYPHCRKHSDLLQLFPERTLGGIYRMVSKYGLQKSGPLMKADALDNLTWTDLQAFPDKAKSLGLAKIATAYCRKEKRQMAALWVMPADLSTRDVAQLYTLTEEPSVDPLIDDSMSQPGR